MKKLFVTTFTAVGMALLLGNNIAMAQDEGGPRHFVPIELWVCNYNDGKDQSDFQEAVDELVEWSEAHADNPYAAWQLFPYYRGADQDFDVLFLGAWPDGSTMGRDNADYIATAQDADEAWNDAVTCDTSVMFAGSTIRDSSGDGTDTFVLTVSDCNVAEGQSSARAMNAIQQFSDYRAANGSDGSTFVWFPAYGGGDAEFDFKLVNGFSGWESLGDYFSWFVDNAAYQTLGAMTGGIVDCDEARVYNGTTETNTWPDSE